MRGGHCSPLPAGNSAPGVVELKAEKQRADQREGLKPKPDQKATKSLDEEAKDAIPGATGWLSRNKPIAALAVVAVVAVCVQALGIADVKLAVTDLLSPIATALWKVRLGFYRTIIHRAEPCVFRAGCYCVRVAEGFAACSLGRTALSSLLSGRVKV